MKLKLKHIPGIEFILLILVLIMSIFGVLGVISYQNTSRVLKNSIIDNAVYRSRDNADLINQHITEFKTIIEGVSYRAEIQSMNWSLQKPILIEEAKRIKVLRFLITDLKGYAHSTTGDELDLSDRLWVQKALKGETYISEPFQGRIDNNTVIVCSTPIRNKEGIIIGSLSATLDPAYLHNIVRKIKIGETGTGYIISKEGKIIAQSEKEVTPSKQANVSVDSEYGELYTGVNANIIGHSFYKYAGESYFAAYARITDSGWYLVLAAPEDEVFKELDLLRGNFIVLTCITIAFGIFCCLLLAGYFFKTRVVQNLQMLVEEDKRLLKESAELEKLRTQFFANITHEFRTPLNVILASIQLCKFYFDKERTPNTNNLSKHLKTMKQNCYRLMRLVNNLIDTTKIDVGFLEKHASNHNIVKIVEDIVMSIQEFTENKGINLSFEKNIEAKVIACDVDKIERIMLNLISNSIKFTDQGGSIFVKVQDKGDTILISVKDTGIGIPEDKQSVIFERFVQVEQTLTKNKDGSGIGLAMVKSFVEMHGGSIYAVSEFGKGSEFFVELPVTIVEKKEEEVFLEEVETQRRIERINIEFSDIYLL